MAEPTRPLLSYFTPVYNREATLPRLFASFSGLPQDKVELVFVDDCSTDRSRELLREFCAAHSNARLIELERNQGVANAFNVGIANARGEYVVAMGSDDVALPDGMNQLIERLEHSKPELLIGLLAEERKDGSQTVLGHVKVPLNARDMLNATWRRPFLMQHGLVIRKDYLDRHEIRFDRLVHGCDAVWKCRISEHLKTVEYIPVAVAKKYYTAGSLSKPTRTTTRLFGARYVELIYALVHLGSEQMRRGNLDLDAFADGMRHRSGHIMRWLRKSGYHGQVLGVMAFMGKSYGTNYMMWKEFMTCLPLGLLKLLLPWPQRLLHK